MAGLKLSELNPDEVKGVDDSSSLKLSDLHPDQVQGPNSNPVIPQPEQVGQGEALLRGGAQGATLGYSDELMGALQALKHKALPEESEKGANFKDLYEQFRDIQRSKNKAAEEQNPYTYGAGNIIGGVGSIALAPEALAAKLGTVGGATALGAATGLGTSEANDVGGMAKDTAIGAGLGAVGGKIGQKLGEVLNPETLEVAGSKLASGSVGLKPSKELSSLYNEETGQVSRGSDIIKGIGKTAMNEGALPLTGGPSAIYDKSLEAIDSNYKKLGPIFEQTQQKLEQNMPDNLEAAGNIGDKTAKFLYDFRDSLSTDPDQNAIMDKIEKKYIPYIEQMSQSDGNLQELNAFKRGLQSKATDLSAAAYDQPASDLKPEAEFVKRLGGIVRQHIEDLAETVDPQAAQAIKDTNQTLSNMFTYNNAVKKLMDKSSSTISLPTAGAVGLGALAGGPAGAAAAGISKLAVEKATGQPISRFGQMLAGKGLNEASKAINTPAGELVQKAVVSSPLPFIANPFSQEKAQSKFGNGGNTSTQISKSLYNATDDSLKEVADKIKSVPGMQFYADHLNKAIDTNDEGEKNRAIFLILQNPKARRLVTPQE